MKIAVSSSGCNLDAKVASRFSTAEYLLIIDVDSGAFEALSNPVAVGRHGAGVQAILLAVSRGANAVLTGYCSPLITDQLKHNDIEILTGITGTVRDAVELYKKRFSSMRWPEIQHGSTSAVLSKGVVIHSLQSSARQFVTFLPVLIGVVLLIGLFDAFVSGEMLIAIFSGKVVLDTLWGACFGSIFAGNPINSYVIGGQLLKYGVSLFAITAFILTWVTVGLVQLPAEIAAFGKRFSLLRNGLSFLFSIPIAILTVLILNFITRLIS